MREILKRYVNSYENLTPHSIPNLINCLHKNFVFVDPFNMGNFLTQSECEERLKRCGFGFESDFLSPVSNRRILLRICSNLHQIYQKSQHLSERDRIQKYLIHLAD